jgi:hypothetical protein
MGKALGMEGAILTKEHCSKIKRAPKGTLFVIELERARRFERPTLTLARLCSTPELRPHHFDVNDL